MFTRAGQLRGELIAAIEDEWPVATGEECVELLLSRLAEADVLDELVRVGTVALSRAQDAYDLRDDLFVCPDGPEPQARIFSNALLEALGASSGNAPALAPAAAAAVLKTIEYPGVTFSLVNLRDGTYGVRAEGKFPNSRREAHRVSVSARGFSRDSVIDAAFRAVRALGEHEARENFTVAGARVFDPHDGNRPGDPVPVPTKQVS